MKRGIAAAFAAFIFLTVAGIARSQNGGYSDVADWGAVGDCSTDNTTVLQNAINATPPGTTLRLRAGCFKFSKLTVPNNIKLVGDGWSAPFWGASFGEGSFAPVVTTTSAAMILPTGTISVTSTTGFDLSANVPYYVVVQGYGTFYQRVNTESAFQQIFCSGGTSTTLTGCVGGSGGFTSGATVFQGFVGGTILLSTATSGIAIDWNCSNLSSPPGCQEGGDMSGIFVLGPGANGSALSVSSVTEGSGSNRTATLTTSSAHGITVGSSTGLIVSGVGISACTPTALSESGSTVSATCSGSHGLNPGDEIVSAGNTPSGYDGIYVVNTVPSSTTLTFINVAHTGLGSGSAFGSIKNGNYNRTVLAKATGTTTFTFPMGPFSSLGTGSGGAATLTSIGVALGDSSTVAYQSGLNTTHLGVGNFGICASLFGQNAHEDTLSLDGCSTSLYFDGITTGSPSTDNNFVFTNLKSAGGPHIHIDAFNGGQSNHFDASDLEFTGQGTGYPGYQDPTAMGLAISESDHSIFSAGYLEAVDSNFYGDGIVVRSSASNGNTDGNTFLDNHIGVGGGVNNHSDMHIVGGAITDLIGNCMYGNLIVESAAANTTYIANNIATIVDNSTSSVNLFSGPGGSAGLLGGTTVYTFDNPNSQFVGGNSGSGFMVSNSGNSDSAWRFDGANHKMGATYPFQFLTPVTMVRHEIDEFGTAPSLGTCAGGALAANAQDQSFEVTGATGGSCIVNFGTAFSNKPIFGCNDESSSSTAALAVSTSTSAITIANIPSGHAFMCDGRGH